MDKLSLFDLIELAQLRAIQDALDPSIESVYKIKCKSYSDLFHTPYHVVLNELDPLFVMQSLAEHQFQPNEIEEEIEELLEKLYTIRDPSYSKVDREETEDLVDAVLNKEMKRLGKVKEEPKKPVLEKEIEKDKLKSGGLSFSDLQKTDEMVEGIKGGFRD